MTVCAVCGVNLGTWVGVRFRSHTSDEKALALGGKKPSVRSQAKPVSDEKAIGKSQTERICVLHQKFTGECLERHIAKAF